MKKVKKSHPLIIILIGAVILVVIIGLVLKNTNHSSPTGQNPSPEDAALPAATQYADWTYFRNGYGIKIPTDWKNTSDTGGTAVLEPGTKIGSSITKVSITRLSDQKAPAGQSFTTQTEFDLWYPSNDKVQGKIKKIANVTLDGGKAVMLLSSAGKADPWTVIVWTRKDNFNLYITVNGSGNYSAEDASAINYLTSSFKFEAPPSTGKEE